MASNAQRVCTRFTMKPVTELAGTQLQLLHDRDCGDPNHCFVGEVDQHEQEQQNDD